MKANEHTNTAIVTDIALIEAAALIEHCVVSPSTLFAVNSLVQAVVLHEEIILGMAGLVGMSHPSIDVIHAELGVGIGRIPKIGEFHESLPPGVYPKILHWVASERLVANVAVANEPDHFSVVNDYLRARRLSDITEDAALTERFGVTKQYASREAIVSDKKLFDVFSRDVTAKGGMTLSPNDLLSLRDLAWTAAAGYTLARSVGLDVYHSLIERPFYGDQLRQPRGPLELVRKATEQLEIEEAWFDEVDIPPFFGLILTNATFTPKNFWKLLLDTREKYRRLRQSIGEFQVVWLSAKTRGEQRGLLREQERAWGALMGREEYLAKERITYILGRAATSLGKSLLDDAIKYDEFGQAIGAVGGLVKLWKDIQQVTPSKDGRDVLGHHFGALPEPDHWQSIVTLVRTVNSAAGLAHV